MRASKSRVASSALVADAIVPSASASASAARVAPAAEAPIVSDEPAKKLRRHLLNSWASGSTTAKGVTELACLIENAGVRGVVDLAVNPVKTGDNHARKLKKALDLNDMDDEYCLFYIPMYCKRIDTRTIQKSR